MNIGTEKNGGGDVMFIDKLNKKQEGTYVLEEEKIIVDGKWEGYLNHDNVEANSIYIYTEEKLGGNKVDNYFVSTSAEMPWKLYLKVFSDSEKIFITYESKGDQVEAEDVNLIQIAVNTQNIKVTNLVAEAERLENTKASLTYVDSELLKKYDKDKVYTKEEVEQLIDDLIGGSPSALDTLKEIADALNNDPDFASTMTTELSKKVDKVAGKSLSDENYTIAEKEKLAGIEKDANNYIHPANHSADIITENINKRFVSDIEKKKWNDMESGDISNLAGIGRTTETVKKNADDIKVVANDVNDRWGKTAKDISRMDLNDIVESGIYGAYNCINAPEQSLGYLTVVNSHLPTNRYIQHSFIGLSGSMYIRARLNGLWGSWVKLASNADLDLAKTDLNKKIDKAGDTFTGIAKAHPNTSYTTSQVRNVILSPSDPILSQMKDGEIWIKYGDK